ncbi:MAG: cytochrome c family protein [Alphaproteobacteria bacterium]|nr:MAG: cytochrome c family protein [Alphaproteobacteria bacterium]
MAWDIMEVNKVVAGILVAGLVAKLGGWFADELIEPELPDKPAYPVAVAEQPAGQPAQPEAKKGPSLAALLAQASAEKGRKIFGKCAACHTIAEGAGNRIGPNLHGIVGAPIAHRSDFAYSDALKNHGGTWTYEMLDHWIANPRKAIPGNKMAFAGLKRAKDRADVIAYLRANTPNPPPLPAEEDEGGSAAEGAQ